jgi:hypothetical protein
MHRPSHSLLCRATTLTLAGLLLASALSACSSADHYREHHDAESFFQTLHKQINNGDSLDRVQSLLGQGTPPADMPRVIAAARKAADRAPLRFMQGVGDNDQFLGWRYGKRSMGYLQFRDGSLINFDPKAYADLAPD